MSFLKKFKKEKRVEATKEKPEKPRKKKEKKQEPKIEEKEWFETEGELAVDVYQTKESVVIEAPVAGIKVGELDISIEGDTIKIKGRRERISKAKPENFLLQECYWGAFSREIILPVEVNGRKAEATMEQGVLVIRIPKIKREAQKKIKVKEK